MQCSTVNCISYSLVCQLPDVWCNTNGTACRQVNRIWRASFPEAIFLLCLCAYVQNVCMRVCCAFVRNYLVRDASQRKSPASTVFARRARAFRCRFRSRCQCRTSARRSTRNVRTYTNNVLRMAASASECSEKFVVLRADFARARRCEKLQRHSGSCAHRMSQRDKLRQLRGVNRQARRRCLLLGRRRDVHGQQHRKVALRVERHCWPLHDASHTVLLPRQALTRLCKSFCLVFSSFSVSISRDS